MREPSSRLNLLLIEDNPADVFLLRSMLDESPLAINEIFQVDRLMDAIRLLTDHEVHLTLLDLSLPDSTGLDSFLVLNDSVRRVPVIILTGLSDEEVAVQAIQAGAKDYLVKGEITKNTLIRAIRYSLERRKLERQFEVEQQSRHQEITSAVLKAQEKERKHLAGELHDNINQILASVKLFVATAIEQPDLASGILPNAHGQLSLAMKEIRKLSRKLMSPDFKTGTLGESLENMISDLRMVSAIRFELSLAIDENLLTDDQKVVAYRIVQEALNNILKHAHATVVVIRLSRRNDGASIMIHDNGVGFDLKNVRKGVGLRNLTSRAEMLNGEALFESSPGNGCTIRILLPLLAQS